MSQRDKQHADVSIAVYDIFRPLLSFPKEDILRWCEELDINFVTDPTNYSA